MAGKMIFRRLLIVVVVLCLVGVPLPRPVANAAAPTYRALVIGNNAYKTNPLKGCINDAKAMRSALQLSTGIQYSRITLATDLSSSAILSALDGLRSWGQQPGDVTLLYYSGHGFLNASGQGGIVGTDGLGVTFAMLEQRLSMVPGTIAVLMDSCYAGGLIGKSAGSSIGDFNSALINALYAGAQPKVLSGNKYHVITACSTREKSYESGGYGYFTTGVSEAMGWNSIAGKRYSTLIGDKNKDGVLTMDEGFAHTRKIVGEMREQSDQNVKISPSGSQLALVSRTGGTGNTGNTGGSTDVEDVPPQGAAGVPGLPNLPNVVLATGRTYQLTHPTTLSWSSNNPAIAAVNSAGLVTGMKAGKTVVSGKRNGKTAVKLKVEVTTLAKTCQQVTLNAVSANRAVGATFTLRASVTPASAKDKTVRWHSTDKTIASVSQKGVVKPRKPGSVRIYAVGSSGECAALQLTVTECKVNEVKQKKGTASIKVGKVLQLEARALPKYASNRKLTWSSEDESIAIVGAESGVVRVLSRGKVYVTAKATDGSGASSRVLITVK